ncbi:MAG: hypothetical protein KKB79_01150 [Nanoarchaeota archaeon]|nr:hypothetical protein [Nanoarchaeota archaeon]
MVEQKDVAQKPIAPPMTPQIPAQPAVAGAQPVTNVPAGAQPGVAQMAQPGMPPAQKKSKWWLWAILILGVVVLLTLVGWFVFLK